MTSEVGVIKEPFFPWSRPFLMTKRLEPEANPSSNAKQEGDLKRAVFGELLRFWREIRGFSQESLAFEANSSTRHISRMENGKAMPSFAMIENLAQVMELGNRDAAYLFLAAGHVPPAEPVEFDDSKYRWLRKAMTRTLKALDPNPSVLMDSFGTILMANKAWASFCFDGVDSMGGMAAITNYHDLDRRFCHHSHRWTAFVLAVYYCRGGLSGGAVGGFALRLDSGTLQQNQRL